MSVGETPIITVAPAIANAIHDAVGVRIKSLPITAQKVLAAIKNNKND
jgi:xanthine dehydrogenase molybdenum-binding subunit